LKENGEGGQHLFLTDREVVIQLSKTELSKSAINKTHVSGLTRKHYFPPHKLTAQQLHWPFPRSEYVHLAFMKKTFRMRLGKVTT